MPKDLEKNLLGNVVDEGGDEEEDEEEDEDYNPEGDNESAGSEIDEDDEVDADYDGGDGEGGKKRSKTNSISATTTTRSGEKSTTAASSTEQLVKVDEDKITLLWSEFCKDVSSKPEEKKDEEPPKEVEKKVVVTKEYDFAGETVTVEEEVTVPVTTAVDTGTAEKVSAEASNGSSTTTTSEQSTAKSTPPPQPTTRPAAVKRTSGLSSVLSQLNKKPKMSTLTKSMHDWTKYKKEANLEEELEAHKRSKDSFMERQAFLGRTDLREFEREKSIRDHERKMRELNSKPK